MIYTVINCFGAIIEYFALYTFLWIFFDVHPKRKTWRISCHIIMPILFFLFASCVSSSQLRPPLFIVCSWVIAYGFSGSSNTKFFAVALFQVCLILFEFLVAYIVSPGADFSHENTYLAINILVKIGTVAIIFILFFISKRHKAIFSTASKFHTIVLFSFSITSFFLVMLIDYLISLLGSAKYFIFECIAIVLCIIINIAMYYLFYQLSVGEEAQKRLKLMDFYLSKQKEEQNHLDHTYQKIRKISHDMNRYLSVIYSLLCNGKTEEAINELQKQQIEISNNQLFDTGYPVINSVLSYKIQMAQNLNIRSQLFWNLERKLNINVSDLAVILSNALDNAIEATCNIMNNEKRFLSIVANLNNNYFILKISNSTSTVPEITDGKIATTKKDKQFHGFGLESIKNLAQKYDGDSFIEYDDHIFTLTIVMENHPLN